MKFKTQYDYAEPLDVITGTVNDEPSMTQQSDMESTDINVILKQYGVTGQLPNVLQEAIYGDFTGVTDYSTAVQMIRAADEAFAEIPAKVREDFQNDPAKFMAFAQDEKNYDKLVEYGLATKRETIPPDPIEQEANETQDLRDIRYSDRGVEPPLPPTDKSTRNPDVQNRSQQPRPK